MALWPPEDQEAVPACPACGGADRRIWHTGLVDRVAAAPGTWSLVRCQACRAAWMDPRPTRESILRAYAGYHTHGPVAAEAPAGIRTAVRQGYLRSRWGYTVRPAWPFGRHLLGTRRRAAIDLTVRHLPRPEGKARLLDVGCGNGAFLLRMRALGWEVQGLEPDPEARASAAAAGIEVADGTLADVAWPESAFEAITMSSVLEHLHDPGSALAACRRLLAPGGTLHIVTPNTSSLGAERFGPHWRGLESPRHLVLFNREALARLLDACGFTGPVFHPHFAGEWFWLVSGAIERGVAPSELDSLPKPLRSALRREGRGADRRVVARPDGAEELVVTARRPLGPV